MLPSQKNLKKDGNMEEKKKRNSIDLSIVFILQLIFFFFFSAASCLLLLHGLDDTLVWTNKLITTLSLLSQEPFKFPFWRYIYIDIPLKK